MSLLMVHYEVKEDRADEVAAEIRTVMAALERDQPAGIHYTMGRLADGVTFVGLLHLDDGVDNPLPAVAEARDYQRKLQDWVVGAPPAPRAVEIVGEYAGRGSTS